VQRKRLFSLALSVALVAAAANGAGWKSQRASQHAGGHARASKPGVRH
jgi:hypothetical protein